MITTKEDYTGWQFLTSPRWLGYYALIIVFSIACVFLGNWQFDRRDQARAEIARIDNNYESAPIELHDALKSLAAFDIDENKWQPVIVRGQYLDEQLLVRGRVSQSGVGSVLLAPLILADGTVFFVDRGWVPINITAGATYELPKTPSGEVEVIARLRQSEAHIKGKEALENSLGSVNLEEAAKLISATAFTGAYGQLISEEPAGETGLLPPKPERDEGPHLSYALQWYVFILIVTVGAWYAATLEYKSINGRAPYKKSASSGGDKPPKKRRLTDAEEEDAYLDAET